MSAQGNQLAAVRDGLKTAMEAADLRTFTIVPDVYTPPAVLVMAEEPYLSFEGASYGCCFVHHRLVVIADVGIDEVTIADLDSRLLKVLAAVPDDHGIDEVGMPGRWDVNGQTHPAVVVRVSTEIDLHVEED